MGFADLSGLTATRQHARAIFLTLTGPRACLCCLKLALAAQLPLVLSTSPELRRLEAHVHGVASAILAALALRCIRQSLADVGEGVAPPAVLDPRGAPLEWDGGAHTTCFFPARHGLLAASHGMSHGWKIRRRVGGCPYAWQPQSRLPETVTLM